MAFRWKFVLAASILIVYVLGILVISVVNLQSPQQKRAPRNSRFATSDSDFHHSHEVGMLRKSHVMQLHWCSDLKFIDQSSPYKFKMQTLKPKETFPGHLISRNSFVFDNNQPVLKQTKSRDQFNLDNEKLGLDSSSTKSDRKSDIINEFSEAPESRPIALASFPGSGNTWFRYLIQQATGILTGSVYKDYGLLKSGFPAENISNSSVLMVKTHEWGNGVWKKFRKAVLLIRDPAKAILAEFNRQSGGHVGFASPDRYKRTKGRYWLKFVTTKLHAWEQTNLSWAKNFTGPILIIYYEDMVDDVEKALREILKFIDYPISEDLLQCALMRKEGIYRRKKRLLTFDPFTPTMKKLIEETRSQVYTELGRYKNI